MTNSLAGLPRPGEPRPLRLRCVSYRFLTGRTDASTDSRTGNRWRPNHSVYRNAVGLCIQVRHIAASSDAMLQSYSSQGGAVAGSRHASRTMTQPLALQDRVFVLTGAGVSAESGLPTFRDADGLWRGHRVEEVATPEAFQANPELVWQFYSERRKRAVTVTPNPAHRALAELERVLDLA